MIGATLRRLVPHLQLIQPLILSLLIADVLPYLCLISSNGRYKVTTRPEMLSGKVLLALSICSSQMNRALILDIADTSDTAYFGGIERSICSLSTQPNGAFALPDQAGAAERPSGAILILPRKRNYPAFGRRNGCHSRWMDLTGLHCRCG